MADTQRARTALLTLFGDNVVGAISEQDFRDFVITVMEEEFVNPGDFWKEPETRETTTDKTARGWKDYSQVMASACSFGNVMALTTDGQWVRADCADSSLNGILALAMDSYLSAESQAIVLRRGMLYNSALSAGFSGFIGRPVYLASGSPGSTAMVAPTYPVIIGFVEHSDDGGSAIGKMRFDAEWSVVGV